MCVSVFFLKERKPRRQGKRNCLNPQSTIGHKHLFSSAWSKDRAGQLVEGCLLQQT